MCSWELTLLLHRRKRVFLLLKKTWKTTFGIYIVKTLVCLGSGTGQPAYCAMSTFEQFSCE
jgi:hypothetical protein